MAPARGIRTPPGIYSSFSCQSYLPFWSYAPLKKSESTLVSKIPRKVFELGQLIEDDE